MKVEDAMSREVRAVPADASMKEAARLLAEQRLSGVPVVDGDGRVLGVLSESDVVLKEAGDAETAGTKLSARLAGEAMTSPAVTIEGDRPLELAARLMLERGVHRLPVVDAAGTLVGIVTRGDLVRAFVRSDAEIAAEIRTEVVARRLWLDPSSVQIEVAEGEVTLTGRLESRADAEALEALARRVPGVVAVRANLTWADDDIEC